MIESLAQENAQVKLSMAGLIRLLAGNGTISKQQLETMVETIDAEDGQIDGKYDGDIV